MFATILLNKYVLGGLVILGIVGGIYYYGWSSANDRFKAYQLQEEADTKLKTLLVQQRDQAIAAINQKQQVVIQTRTQKVIEHVNTYIDRPVYHNVCIDADGLRDINTALSPPPAPTSGTDAKVSEPNPAK